MRVTRILPVVGCKNAGKTRACEVLIKPLQQQGLRVGTLKYTEHEGFDWDRPGKDTYRHREAGSDAIGIFGTRTFAFHLPSPESPAISSEDLISVFYRGCDIVLVEGFRRSQALKLEVCRPEYSDRSVVPEEELLATYGVNLFSRPVPHFDYGLEAEAARYVVKNLDRLHTVTQASS